VGPSHARPQGVLCILVDHEEQDEEKKDPEKKAHVDL